MYADDWRKAAVLYTEWAHAHRHPVPENVFDPPALWGKKVAPPRAPRYVPVPLAPPAPTCAECSRPVAPYPYALGRCTKHWKAELRKRGILSGIRRRAAKRAALDAAVVR